MATPQKLFPLVINPLATVKLPQAEDGMLLPAAFKNAAGHPRFALPIPPGSIGDGAIKHLIGREAACGGYEYPTRAFFDARLEPGDLFIDIGAHWGIMSLTAATRHPGDVQVIAVEAHPENAVRLRQAVAANRLDASVEVICTAAGDRASIAPLAANTTMGHSLYGLGLKGLQRVGADVTVLPLDSILAERPDLADRRVFLKIDVEGYETQVIAGAEALIQSGRVAAFVWEYGRAFDSEPAKSAAIKMMQRLEALGFKHYRLPSNDLGGPLIPSTPAVGSCNVFALPEGFRPAPAYCRPFGPVPPVPPSNQASGDADSRAATTEALIAIAGSEGARWADPAALKDGAEERAQAMAPHIASGNRVLDLGSGMALLGDIIGGRCTYQALDLVPFVEHAIVRDLNGASLSDLDPADGGWDVIVAGAVLEYLHHPDRLLAEAVGLSPSRKI